MTKAITLSFSGADPSGGAGIQADIEAITSMGAFAMPITTALTIQNSSGVKQFYPVDPSLLLEQANCLLEDVKISAIKTGMLANKMIIEAVSNICRSQPTVPLVLDPVLASNSGDILSDACIAKDIRKYLLPITTIITPNLPELKRLVPETDDAKQACQIIADAGCEYVLLTGTHGDTKNVNNQLYQRGELIDEQTWPRLAGEYHGSGCTLASALAALLAQGKDTQEANKRAQDYTWHCLKHAMALGHGQYFPNRFYWRD